LAYLEDPKTCYVTEKEMEKLKIIIAKKYPAEIEKLVKKEKDPTEFRLEKKFIENTVSDIVDEYTKHTENVQNNEDVQSSYYIQSKNLSSKVHIATTGRQKGPKSMTDNLRKEFMKSLTNTIPSDFEQQSKPKKGKSLYDIGNKRKLIFVFFILYMIFYMILLPF